MVTHHRAWRLPEGAYSVIGLVSHKAQGGQGDIGYQWTWLCRKAQSQPVLLTEVYDISWWAPGGSGPCSLTAEHLYEVTEEALTEQQAESYLGKLEQVCQHTFPPPIFTRLSAEEKVALSR